MATYKLIQDIEADDKLLGPLSFRQFIYAAVAVVMLYLSFVLIKHHAALLTVMTIPVALVGGFLAYPFGKDQPTEVWAISKLRFYTKPRLRIWAQSGVKELVTVTVPKKVEIQRTDGLSHEEVLSRLSALANTIDSRGWAIKNVSGAYQTQTALADSDRLISADALPKFVPDEVVSDTDDLFNENSNPIAIQVGQMLNADTAQRHQALIENLNNSKGGFPAIAPHVIASDQTSTTSIDPAVEEELDEKLKAAHLLSHTPLNNMHALRQAAQGNIESTETKEPDLAKSTTMDNPVIMNYSQRDDLNLNVISNEVNKAIANNDDPKEVLITLH